MRKVSNYTFAAGQPSGLRRHEGDTGNGYGQPEKGRKNEISMTPGFLKQQIALSTGHRNTRSICISGWNKSARERDPATWALESWRDYNGYLGGL